LQQNRCRLKKNLLLPVSPLSPIVFYYNYIIEGDIRK
jgi:hypothetical protein